MKVVLVGRADKGGMKTHLETLRTELSKRHEVRVLTQEDFRNINIYSGLYYINLSGLKKIREALTWCDIMHCHHPSFSHDFIIPRLKSDTPIVNTFHGSLGESETIFNRKAKMLDYANKAMLRLLGRAYKRRSSRFIAVGQMQQEILKRYNDTVVINNGISLANFKKAKAERYFSGFTVGYVGRVDPEKNVETLILACKELGVNLVIAGMSTEYEMLRRRHESATVKFAGKQPYPPVAFYNAIDVFCSPAFIEANICLTTLEAMACERPVIVSGCGGEESHIDESFGIVTRPDQESLKRAIVRIQGMDLASMGKKARHVVKEQYDIRDMVRKVETVYQKAIAEKRNH